MEEKLMAEQYAGLSLGVDVSQVTFAVKSLKQFKRANEEAAQGVKDFVNQEQIAREQAKRLREEIKRQRQAFESVQSAIDPTAAKIRRLSAAAGELDKLWQKGVVPDEEFFNLSSMIESQIGKLERNKRALTEEGRAAIEESRNKEKAAKSGAAFLASLEEQANAIGRTKTELLEMKAAQLGVSAQAAPFIQQLKAQEKQMGLAGLTAGQYSQAMRMLPAQITDVVTSLASGMPIWLVAIQQGGQIKDSFGGISNTFKVLMSYLTPARILIGGVVGTVAALAKAGYDAYDSQRTLQKALIMTGGYAGSSATEIKSLVDEIAGSAAVATSGQIMEVATAVAKTGKFTKDELKTITKATADWVATTGESTEKVIGYFEKIAKDPIKGLAELNETFNFLDKGQLTYIATLEKTKGKIEAVEYATELFAKTMKGRSDEIAESATPLEKMWIDIKQWASEAWEEVGIVTLTAGNMIADVVMGVVNQIRLILAQGDKMIADFLVSVGNKTSSLPVIGSWFQGVAKEQAAVAKKSAKEISELEQRIAEIDGRLSNPAGYRKMVEEQGKFAGKSKEVKEAVSKEADSLKDRNKEQKVTIDQGTRLLDQYEQDLIALQTQLQVLKEHRDINDKISQQRKNLWNTQARFQVLEKEAQRRQLTADERAELANKDKILALREQAAVIGDQITKQEQLIKREQDAAKFLREQAAAIAKIQAQAQGKSDRQASRDAELEQIKSSWLNQGGSLEDQELQAMLAKRQEYYSEEDSLRGNWLAGIKKSWAEYGETVNDINGQIENIGMSALSGLSDQLTEFLTTGKASFKDFASSIIGMIVKMIAQMVIFNTLSGLMPGGGGGSFSFANMLGGGGKAAKGYANGGYTGDGGKYEPKGIVHGGEFVFTKEATKRIGTRNLYKLMRGYANGGIVGGNTYGGASTSATGSQFTFGDINVDINNGNDPKGLETGVKMIFTEMIQRACAQGGEVYNFVNSKRG
ncbi:MAG: tail length tape measure protein [Bacteriophage sp.]|nr:MAG: tail length tape measure protein [Bacteriophage sp.]